MDKNSCATCGAELKNNRYFCPICGALIGKAEYTREVSAETVDFKVRRIHSNLDRVPHVSIEWDNTIDVYSSKMEKLRALMRTDEFGANADKGLIDKIDQFIQTCRKPEFQIAFVGTIKTGKSTLINALLGHNYASMAVTPETAALTKFRSSDKDYVKVTFYSEKEWSQLWKSITSGADKFMEEYKRLNAESVKSKWVGHETRIVQLDNLEIENELSVWSSSKHPEHYFVKEIEVGISTLPAGFPKQVVFVDTPGLSDPVGYRSDITKRYIKRANAVFVCVEAKKLNKEEVDTISSVFSISSHNKEKVYIIGTHWDKLNFPLKDWPESRKFIMEQVTGKGFYDTNEIAESHLIHSSAYQYILCRDYHEGDTAQQRQLMMFALALEQDISNIKKLIPTLSKYSNVDTISEIISNDLVKNYTKYLRGDLIAQYQSISRDLKRYAETIKDSAEDVISAADASMEDLQKRLADSEKKYRMVQDSQKALTSALEAVNKQSQAMLAKLVKILDEGGK